MPCVSSRLQLCVQNCDPPPQTHTFLKWRFLTDFEKHTHTPPKVTTFWCIRPKVEKSLKKCENAPCWQETNVPERYAKPISASMAVYATRAKGSSCEQRDTHSTLTNPYQQAHPEPRTVCLHKHNTGMTPEVPTGQPAPPAHPPPPRNPPVAMARRASPKGRVGSEVHTGGLSPGPQLFEDEWVQAHCEGVAHPPPQSPGLLIS